MSRPPGPAPSGGELAIAVDVGGSKTLAGLVDRSGAVVRRLEEETELGGRAALLDQLERLIDALADAGSAIGVAVPSMVDQRAGRAVLSINVPLRDLDLTGWLGRFDRPAAIENDANAATLAEHRLGAGRGVMHMVMLTLGTGIGGGVVVDGRLYRGTRGAAGELGHITLDVDGPSCQGACPGVGHLECLASGTALERLAAALASERPRGDLGRAAASGRVLDARVVVELAARAPGDARNAVEAVARYLGLGIASLVNIFDPELVVVGGGFAEAGDLLLEPARRIVAATALPPAREEVRIVAAELGPDAGLIGAGLRGFEALAHSPGG